MIYITGDTHREFYKLHDIEKNMLITLVDVGINYYLYKRDKMLKEQSNSYNIKPFCVQGNHEESPENISTYKEINMFGGKAFIKEEYQNIIFAKNGKLYDIGKKVLVIGGAYSIDKNYRIIYGYPWFKDEQLSKEEVDNILNKYKGQYIDIILSHTRPLKYESIEVFMKGINQSDVDKSMGIF